MRFEWDEDKNATNICKHRIDFAEVPSIFNGPMLVGPDDREDYGEGRWIGIGLLRNIITVVVFAQTGYDPYYLLPKGEQV